SPQHKHEEPSSCSSLTEENCLKRRSLVGDFLCDNEEEGARVRRAKKQNRDRHRAIASGCLRCPENGHGIHRRCYHTWLLSHQNKDRERTAMRAYKEASEQPEALMDRRGQMRVPRQLTPAEVNIVFSRTQFEAHCPICRG
ncbi:unnamed protein product, partial [Amoebophrya sp. A25]